MKNLWLVAILFVVSLSSCKNADNNENIAEDSVLIGDIAYNSYGEEISTSNILSATQMEERFQNLLPGDTIEVSFQTTINTVCKNKGCWMTLDLPNEEEDIMVKFKDYGFFVPKDADQKEVVVNGKAYVAQVPVDEQQHYAEDKGASQEEISAITQPKRTYSFLADGVLIKQ